MRIFQQSDPFDRLSRNAKELGRQTIIMPIDEIRLAHEFSILPDQPRIVGRLIAELFDHENMHVRRIAVNASRRSGAFDTEGLQVALTRRLSDPEPWVRYDAAWAVGEAGYDSPEIRAALIEEAANCTPDDDRLLETHRSDDELQARVKARDVLQELVRERGDAPWNDAPRPGASERGGES